MAKNTDPVQMLTDIANGFDTIAASIKKIKLPKKSPALKQMQLQTINLVNQNKKLVDELRVLRREFEVLRTVAIKYGTDASNAENKVERTAKKTADAAKKRREEYTKANKKAFGALSTLGGVVKQQLAWYPMKAVTLGTLQALRAIPQVTAEYEQALKDISAVSRMADSDLTKLSKTITQVGISTKYSMIEVAKAGKILAQSGLRGKELSGALQPLAEMAAATSATLESAARLQTTVMRAYSMSTDQFNEISDSVVNAVAGTRLSLEDLNVAFSYTASAARQTGVSFTETITLLGLLRNAGLEASTAATGLRMALLKITAPTRKAQKVLDQVGLSKKDLDIANRGIFEVLKSLNKLSKQSIIDIFGARSANAMLAFKNISVETAEALEKVIQLQGTAEFTAAMQMDTLSGQWKLLFDNLKSMAIDFGNVFKDDVTNALKTLITTIQLTQRALSGWGPLLKNIAYSFAGIYLATKGWPKLLLLTTKITKGFKSLSLAVTALHARFMGFILGSKAAQSSLLMTQAVLGPLAIAIGAVSLALLDESIRTKKLEDNLHNLHLSYAKLNTNLAETVLKLQEIKDLNIGQTFERAALDSKKVGLKEDTDKFFKDALKLNLSSSEKKEITEAWQKSVKELNNAKSLEDIKDIEISIIKREKLIVTAIKNSAARIKKTLETDLGVEADLTWGFSIPETNPEDDKQLAVMLEDLKKREKSSKKYADLAENERFTQAMVASKNNQTELDNAHKYNSDISGAYKQIIENKKKYLEGLAELNKTEKALGDELNDQQWAELIQNRVNLENKIEMGENWLNLTNLDPQEMKAAKSEGNLLGEQVRTNLLKDLKQQLLGSKTKNEVKQIHQAFFENYDKAALIEAKRILKEKDYDIDAWLEKLLPAASKGKEYAQQLIYGIKATDLRNSITTMTAEIRNIRAKIYQDGIVQNAEYYELQTTIEKDYDVKMKKIKAAYYTNLKNGIDKEMALRTKALDEKTALMDKEKALSESNLSKLQAQFNAYQESAKSYGTSGLRGNAKVDAIKSQRTQLRKLIEEINYANEFDPEDSGFVKLLQSMINLETKLNNDIKNTNKSIAQSKISAYNTQIDSLMQQRDYLNDKGQLTQVIELNKQLLDIKEKLTNEQITQYLQQYNAGEIDEETLIAQIKAADLTLQLFNESLDPILSKAKEQFQSFQDGVTSGFSNFFSSLVEGTESVGEAFKQLGKDILKTFTDIITKNLAEQLFNSLFNSQSGDEGMMMGFFKLISSWAGAGQAHNGMTVSSVTPRNKHVNPLIFANAPRLHDGYNLPGLRQSEFPAILEQGETVLPKNYQATNQAPSVTINMENKSSQRVKMKTTGTQFDGEEYIINTIITDAANNGAMRQVL